MNVEINSLSEAYHHTITTVLQFPCTLEDDDLNTIHQNILATLIRYGQDFGINTQNLGAQVQPIFEQAKVENSKRKFGFKTSERKTQGRFTFPIREKCEVISGKDNYQVLWEIRQWLCDFGDEHDGFSIKIYGHHHKMAEGLERLRGELKVTSLMPAILTRRCLSIGSLWEPDIGDFLWGYTNYIQVPPIQVEFLFHEPSSVTGNLEIGTQVIRFAWEGNIFDLNMPLITDNSTLNVIFDGELEYSVTKGVYGRKWNKIVTFGIAAGFDVEKTVKKVHQLTLKMKCQPAKIKMRNRIQIKISRESADKFMNEYRKYKSIKTDEHKHDKHYKEQLALKDAQVLVNCHEPWREYVQAMREGGPKAFNEMVFKKPLVLKDLPKDINNVAGIAFEELQIARVMAEAQKKNIPLELFAGDGQGVYQFNDCEIRTPEYVDAVFQNRDNKKFYAVQFKFSDNPESLVEMMTHWRATHVKNQPRQVPDALLLDNVQLIGPKEVVDKLIERGQYKSKIDVGFKHTPMEREAVIKFIENNKEALKNIVKDKNVDLCRKMETDLRREKVALAQKETRIKDAYAKLQEVGINPNKVENIKKEIEGKESNYKKCEVKYQENKQIYDETNKSLQKQIKKEMTKGIAKTGMKHVLTSAAVGLVTDGVISLVISGDMAIRQYVNSEINAGECAWHIVKQTSLGLVRGGVIATAICIPEVAARIAVYAGYGSAGAVLSPIAKLAGPAFMTGMIWYSAYNICKQAGHGDITSADAKKAAWRLSMSTAFSTGGMIAAGTLVGGPLGLVVGAGFSIALAVGDYYLGDKLWSLIITENPKERTALIKRKQQTILNEVLEAAYKLLDISEYASNDELKEAVKAARHKYHPDKGGDAEIFMAVEDAFKVIKAQRGDLNLKSK